ncbi:hemophore-related protein [Mycolicibacterium hassiacum]|nr:hemophore-related protein [Mycolicibacterium hassiacum]
MKRERKPAATGNETGNETGDETHFEFVEWFCRIAGEGRKRRGRVRATRGGDDMKPLVRRICTVVGGMAIASTVGSGIAFAQPNLDSAVDTTCTYPQLAAALTAHDPAAGSALNASPQMQSALQQFVAAPPNVRRQMAAAIVSHPANQPYLGTLQTMFDTCSNF